ncbi:type III pantothenate kinase [Bacillus sp. SL00103]
MPFLFQFLNGSVSELFTNGTQFVYGMIESRKMLFLRKLFKVVMKLLLVIDVGNTNTVLGVYHNGDLNYHWRIEQAVIKQKMNFGMAIRSLFGLVSG